jgi:hypothetical protein
MGPVGDIPILVLFHGKTIEIAIFNDTSVEEIKTKYIAPRTSIHSSSQKLLHRGKVLKDSQRARNIPLINGSKIMLVASTSSK